MDGAPMTDRYCKVYIHTELPMPDLEALIGTSLAGEKHRHTIVGELMEVDVRRNDEFDPTRINEVDGFMWSKYYLDIVPRRDGGSFDDYVSSIAHLLKTLDARGCRTVPSCDFEDKLHTVRT
jgi:hypothetical protein